MQMNEERVERMNEVNRMCEEMVANARGVERASLAKGAELDRQTAAKTPSGILGRMSSLTRASQVGHMPNVNFLMYR